MLPLHTLCLCLPAAEAPILHRSTLCFCLPTQLLMHQCANTAPITSTSSAAKARVVSVTASSCSDAAAVQVYWQALPDQTPPPLIQVYYPPVKVLVQVYWQPQPDTLLLSKFGGKTWWNIRKSTRQLDPHCQSEWCLAKQFGTSLNPQGNQKEDCPKLQEGWSHLLHSGGFILSPCLRDVGLEWGAEDEQRDTLRYNHPRHAELPCKPCKLNQSSLQPVQPGIVQCHLSGKIQRELIRISTNAARSHLATSATWNWKKDYLKRHMMHTAH